ncbi:MAG: hypothetical protein PHT40_02300 [Patescibacteria group bacterium]|nr:hypothetical protein [Patescibacteria group bacterium]
MFRCQNYHAQKTENHAQEKSRGFISLTEAAELCTYSQEYLSLLARRGELRAQKFGNNWFTKTKWLKKYVAEHAEGTILNGKGKFLAKEKMAMDFRSFREEVEDLIMTAKKKTVAVGRGGLVAAVALAMVTGAILVKPNYVRDFALTEIKLARIGVGEIKNILWSDGVIRFGVQMKEVVLGMKEDFLVADNLSSDPLQTSSLARGRAYGLVAGAKTDEIWKNFVGKLNRIKILNVNMAQNFENSDQEIYLVHNYWQKIGGLADNFIPIFSFVKRESSQIIDGAAKIIGKAGERIDRSTANFGGKIGEWFSSFQKTEWDPQLLSQLAKKTQETQIVYQTNNIINNTTLVSGNKTTAGPGVIDTQGTTGINGATGKTGSQGPRGEKGETGPQGLQGIQGPAGICGGTCSGSGGSVTNIYNVGVQGATAHDGAGSSLATKYLGAGELSVSGNTSLVGVLTVGGGASFSSGVSIAGILNGGNATFGGVSMATLNATTTNADSLYIFNNATTTGAQYIGGDLTVAGTAVFTGGSSFNSITTTDTAYIGGRSFLMGNVGIGTTNATATLLVISDQYEGAKFVVASSTALATPSLYVDKGGNVGIGKTNPEFKLDVAGIINATSLYVDGSPYVGSQWTTAVNDIYYNTGNVGIGITNPAALFEIATTTTDWAAGTRPLMRVATKTTEALYVGASGNVGIGTTVPTSTLQVAGNFNITTTSALTTNQSVFFVNNATKNVGIGTTAPGAKLEVNGSILPSSSLANDLGSGTRYYNNGYIYTLDQGGGVIQNTTYIKSQGSLGIFPFSGGTTATLRIGSLPGQGTTYSYKDIYFDTADVNRMYIANAGNVGIGTTNPQGALSVMNGNVGIGTTNPGALFEIATTTTDWAAGTRPLMRVATKTTEAFYIAASGNVGIGTTNPQYKFDIAGYASSTQDIYAANLGYNEGMLEDPTIIDATGAAINISAAYVLIRSSSDWTGYKLERHLVPANTALALTDNDLNYVYINYNSGSPIYAATTNRDVINNSNAVPVSRIMMTSGNIEYKINYGAIGKSVAIRNFDRVMRTRGITGIERESGLAISESASRVLSVTSGYVWFGMDRITIDAMTVGTGGATAEVWYHSGGNWVASSTPTYEHLSYDNGTNLTTLTANRYAVNWVFRNVANGAEIDIILGSGDYTLAQAEASMLPSLPEEVTNFYALVARIIIKKNNTVAYAIENEADFSFRQAAVTIHNDLSSIQGGTTGEYYHLTASEQIELNGWLDDAILTSTGGLSVNSATTTGSFYFPGGVVMENGNVGIGTTVPTSTLQVAGNFNITTTSALTTNESVFFVNNATKNVGIGTTTPLTSLSVQGAPGKPVMNIASSTGASLLYVGEDGKVNIGGEFTGAYKSSLNVTGNAVVTGIIYGPSYGATINMSTGKLTNTSSAMEFDWTNGLWSTYRTNITLYPYGAYDEGGGKIILKGNVGIGTTNPQGALSVMNGNVGIGMTNPIAVFEIATTSNDWVGGSNVPLMRVSTKTTEVFYINATGNVGIGTTAPLAKLNASSTTAQLRLTNGETVSTNFTDFNVLSAGDLIIDPQGTATTTFVRSNLKVEGNATTTGSLVVGNPTGGGMGAGTINAEHTLYVNGADYAEYFLTNDVDLQPGEAVCIDVTNDKAVKRCYRGADPDIIGIVSTKPALVGNNQEFDGETVIVGLIGQVPAFASVENGIIRPGDSLTSASSTPGYLMKASAGDSTVGVALTGLQNGTGGINVLISRRNKSLTVEQVEEQVTKRVADMKIEDEVNMMVSDAVRTLGVDEQIKLLDLKVVELEEKEKLAVKSFDEVTANNLKIITLAEIEELKAKNIMTEKITADMAQATTGNFQELVLGTSEERIENSEEQAATTATTTNEGEREKSEELLVNNKQVRITVIDDPDDSEVRIKISGGAEFGGTVKVVNLEVGGKITIKGGAEFLGEATFRNNLNLESALTRTYQEKKDEMLKIGDAVYISGDNEVARAFADIVDGSGMFKPAIGIVIGFEDKNTGETKSLVAGAPRDNITVRVAIGGTIGGFSNLLPGVTYYLSDVETAILANKTTAEIGDGEFSAISSLTNSPAQEVGVFFQPLAVAESTSTLLIMPSLVYQEYNKEMSLAPAEYEPIYVENLNSEINNQPVSPRVEEQPIIDNPQSITDSTPATTTDAITATSTPVIEEITPPVTEEIVSAEEPLVITEAPPVGEVVVEVPVE